MLFIKKKIEDKMLSFIEFKNKIIAHKNLGI
jgi:hypothetical protein